ncbi:MAG: lysophospholipid acyltransferase family protein [Clostridia bacterium]
MTDKTKSSVKQPRYKKPSIFVYFILWIAALYAKIRFRIRTNREEIKAARKVKSPVLVLGNHSSPIDFIFMVHTLFPKRLGFVVAAGLYYDKRYAWAIKLLGGAIPKKQFSTDYSVVKNVKKMTDAGVSIGIYPEGRCSMDGRESPISEAIYKLIKWLKIPVIMVCAEGAYLSRPRYATDFRRGQVKVSVKTILGEGEAETLSLEEIKERLLSNMKYNDFKYQRENNIRVKGKKGTTVGVERLIYKCPKCKAEFKHITEGNFLHCTACENHVELTEYGELIVADGDKAFDRLDLWYDYQKEQLKKEAEDPDYSWAATVSMYVNDEDAGKHIFKTKGTLAINRDGYLFNGEDGTALSFKIGPIPSAAIILEENVMQFYREDDIYRFVFEGEEKPVKFEIAESILGGR